MVIKENPCPSPSRRKASARDFQSDMEFSPGFVPTTDLNILTYYIISIYNKSNERAYTSNI